MGRVFRRVELSIVQNMLDSFSAMDFLDNAVKETLRIMPEGTRHVSTHRAISTIGLSTPYVILLEHPVFPNETEIVMQYEKSVVMESEDDSMKKYEVLVNFEYINPDGTKRYER